MRRFATLSLLVAALAAPATAQQTVSEAEIRAEKEADRASDVAASRLDAPAARLEVGPDGFGYVARDETEPDGPTYDFVDISFTGTVVVSGDDTGAGRSLSFPFPYYGQTYTTLYASTNGFLSTANSDLGDLGNDSSLPAPFGGNGARMYVLHDDLVTTVYYDSFGTCPRAADSGPNVACDIFQWGGEHWIGAAGVLVQAVLYETGDIVYQYAGDPEAGNGSTVGIQSEANGGTPQFGLAYQANQNGSIVPGRAVWFTDNSPTSGIPVSFASIQRAVSEDAGTVEIELTVEDTPDAPQDVTVTLIGGDSDDLGGFTSETITIGPGTFPPYVITVPVTDDLVLEDTETFLFSLSVGPPASDDGGTPLAAGDPAQFALLVGDNDVAATVSAPAGDGLRLLSFPVGGLTAADVASAAGADAVFVYDPAADAFVEADPGRTLDPAQPVLVDVDTDADLEVTGSAIAGPVAFAIDADADRVLVALGNPTDAPVSLGDVEVTGGTLADVALVFEDGAFVPVTLDADALALGAFGGVILQVTPDGDPADVAVSVSAEAEASDDPLVTEADYTPAEGETTVGLTLTGDEASDVAVVRFQVGEPSLDPLDALDIASPSGLTLGTPGWGAIATGGPFAALAGWDLEDDGPATLRLLVEVPAAGDYELSLTDAPGAVGPRDVIVELRDGTETTTLDASTPYAFSVADGEDLTGRFSLLVSLGAGVATEPDPQGVAMSVYPNPSAGATTVALAGVEGDARVAVYDALGREVLVLHDGLAAGSVQARVEAGQLAPGAYVVRAATGTTVQTRSLTVVR